MTILTPGDSLKVARPTQGIAIRVRGWWESNRQFLKKPVYQLERLMVDGQEVHASYVETKDQRGQIVDSYYLYKLERVPAKDFEIQAVIRNVVTGDSETLRTTYNHKTL